MNKKLSLMMAALLAAGYSVTAEAGVVKVTAPVANAKYVIAVENFTLAGSDLALTAEGGFKGLDISAITNTELWTVSTATTAGKISNVGTGTFIQSGSAALGDAATAAEFSNANPLAKGVSGTDYFHMLATPVWGASGSNGAYLYAVTAPLAEVTDVYVTLNGKYLVNPTGTNAVLLDGTTVMMLGLQDKAKWSVDADGKITNASSNGITDITSSAITIAAKAGAVAIETDKYNADNTAVYTAAAGVSTALTGVTTDIFKVGAAAPSIAPQVPAGALAWTNGTTGVLYVNPAEDVTTNNIVKEIQKDGTVNTIGTNNPLTIKLNSNGTYSLFDEDAKQVSLENAATFTIEKIAGTNGFIAKDADGKVLSITGTTLSWEATDGNLAAAKSVAVFSFSKGTLQPISAADLAKIEKSGITLSASYDDGKTDIKGNPFVGFLTVVDLGGNNFNLKSGKKFIIGRKNMIEGSLTVAYGFTTVDKLADMKGDDLAVFTAQTYAGETTPSEVVLSLTGAGTVGYYKVPDGVYMGAGNNPKTVTFSLGAGTAVKPSELLIKNHFYTIVKVDEKEGNSSLAVKLADNNNSPYTAYGKADFLQNVNNDLEKQWALTVENGNYVFSNRETPTVKYDGIAIASLYHAKGENTYTSGEDTYIITPVAVDPADGYERLKNLRDTKYNLAYWSTVYNNAAWFTENHNDIAKDQHVLGLNVDKDAALDFTAFAYDKARKVEGGVVKTASDSIYVISTLGYYNTDGIYDTTKDTLKVVSYAFVNEFNEPLAMGTDKEDQAAYVSKVDKDKYTSADKAKEDAQRFVLRKDGDKLNLRPVELSAGSEYYTFDLSKDFNKMYSGDTERGILADTKMYGRIENDLFTIEATEMPMYRTIVNNLDTISIYRQGNNEDVMYEKGLFLGIANNVQFPTIAPAMVADLAHVDAEGHRPQYLLMVQPNVVEGGTWCPVHGYNSDCPHAQPIDNYTEGRYLVNLKDTAIVWGTDNHQKGNPYVNSENFYKLGFVSASHLVDTLIIKNDSNKIELNKEDYNVAKFAFRYVDNEAKSFVIETADYIELGNAKEGEMKETYGYLKWMNDVVVVVNDIKDADVFNMDEEYVGDPTANENAPKVSSISVVATNGGVIVKGAEGKNVVITNVLGQQVANTTVSSSEATIAAPAGVVVVAVEGEAAVKAIVK